jgi:hypothetical protein
MLQVPQSDPSTLPITPVPRTANLSGPRYVPLSNPLSIPASNINTQVVASSNLTSAKQTHSFTSHSYLTARLPLDLEGTSTSKPFAYNSNHHGTGTIATLKWLELITAEPAFGSRTTTVHYPRCCPHRRPSRRRVKIPFDVESTQAHYRLSRPRETVCGRQKRVLPETIGKRSRPTILSWSICVSGRFDGLQETKH